LNFGFREIVREFAEFAGFAEGKNGLSRKRWHRLVTSTQRAANCCSGRTRTQRCLADILGPEVFRAMLQPMERDQFNEKRSNRRREFILDDHEFSPS